MKTLVFFLSLLLMVTSPLLAQDYQDGPELPSVDEVEPEENGNISNADDLDKPVKDAEPQNEPDLAEPEDDQTPKADDSDIEKPKEGESNNDVVVIPPPSTVDNDPIIPEKQTAPHDGVNVILLVADDLGVGDLGCYYGEKTAAPRICRLAKEGIRFTDFSAPAPDSQSSQRALLTGKRFTKNLSAFGLAALAKKNGYQTAFWGQWLLGTESAPMPTDVGFDLFWGVTTPADNWSFHPIAGELNPPIKLWNNNAVVGYNVNPESYTTHIASRVVKFIKEKRDVPFFACVFFTSPRVPLVNQQEDAYREAVSKLDRAVGDIVDAVDQAGIAESTLIVFLSDNGPNRAWGVQAGNTGPYRADIGFEGSVRVPCIMRWKNKVKPAEYCHFVNQLDVAPTVAQLWGVPSDEFGKREGKSLVDVLNGKTDQLIYKSFAYFSPDGKILAVRAAKWKLYCPQEYKAVDSSQDVKPGTPAPYTIKKIDWELYDLSADPGETTPKNDANPEVFEAIKKAIKQ